MIVGHLPRVRPRALDPGGVAKREWGNHIVAVMGQLRCMSFGGRSRIPSDDPYTISYRWQQRHACSAGQAYPVAMHLS
jgi:hypothetical protein